MHEDNFATLPKLTLAFPAVDQAHPDAAALEVLADYLTDGKDAPLNAVLNAVLIDEAQLTAEFAAELDAEQIADAFMLSIQAFDGKNLDTVQAALDEGFARLEAAGVNAEALGRVKKMREEAAFHGRLGSVLGKGRMLAPTTPSRETPPSSTWAGAPARGHGRGRDEGLSPDVAAFSTGGFQEPLDWYRALDRNWAQTRFLQDQKIRQPALFIVGENDPVRLYAGAHEAGLKDWVPGLTRSVVVPDAGHWIQQERPEAVNALLLAFLKEIRTG